MKKQGGGMFRKVPSGAMNDNKGERNMVMRVGTGSGSRPGRSKIAIESSAPADAYHLRTGASTKGAMK